MRLRLLPVCVALIFSALGLYRVPALAAVPLTISFQGRLTTPAGTPVPDTTTQALTFRIFDAPANGALLWSQAVSNVAVRGGVFTVSLDFSTGFTGGASLDSVLAGTPHMEVQVGADTPMTPRLPLSSSLYALRGNLELLSTGSVDTPVLLGSANTGGNTVSVAVSGGNAYVLNQGLRLLQVFDISNPAALTLKGSVGTGIDPSSVAVSGDAAIVVNLSSNTLQVFDISNPSTPTLKGTTTTALSPASVAVSGAFAYVVNRGNNSLQVFDVSDPTSPTLKGSAATSNGPKSVAVLGNAVYVVNHQGNTLQVFDASNSAAPTLKGTAPTGDAPFAVTVSGVHAFVVNANSNTLQVFDVSNPSAPVLRGSATTGIEPVSVAISGKDAYVGCFGDGLLEVFDMSNPSMPTRRGSSDTTGVTIFPSSVAMSGGFAYVTGANTLHAFALSRMRVAGSLLVQGDASVAGKVGVGTTSPVASLHIRGDGPNLLLEGIDRSSIAFYPNGLSAGRGGYIGYPTDDSTDLEIANEVPGGVVRVRGTFVNASDVRYKTNIGPIRGALASVLGIRGVTYDWPKDVGSIDGIRGSGGGGHRQVGFIAQEVERVRPDLVYTDAEGYKSVSYVNVVPLLVEALKEMEAKKDTEIATLRAQNRTLEQRLQRLEDRLSPGRTGPLR